MFVPAWREAAVIGAMLRHALAAYDHDEYRIPLATLLLINAGLLAWRLAVRATFVTRSHRWREGLRSIPRIVPANAIAMLAARRALVRYWTGRRLARPA